MTTTYPTSHDAVEKLVQEHAALADEPLLLAVYYAPDRNPGDIFLFEVFEGFGANGIDEDRRLFEVAYGAKSNFPLEPGQQLRLVLTNVPEFKRAVSEDWEHVQELKRAIAAGRYEILFMHPEQDALVRELGV
jgi:hypothetical protein